ncbi:hypothetical protein ACP6PL_02490 [Dapis sp. BLCC M126]|uniref:hypothetical protein n=1 Tax=Dapis sp. BLCC M126 TaxID=3400189 RepID=UPI003CE7B13D
MIKIKINSVLRYFFVRFIATVLAIVINPNIEETVRNDSILYQIEGKISVIK